MAQRLSGRRGAIDSHAEAEERVTAEMHDLRHRLAEVEERLDFAERLLTQDAPANQLPRGPQ
jgi:hypothetical protein